MQGELKCGYRNSITIPDCANINLPGSNNSQANSFMSRRFSVMVAAELVGLEPIEIDAKGTQAMAKRY